MSGTTDPAAKVVPAQLAFLSIYNPSFARTDETFGDQIVFWHSKDSKANQKTSGKNVTHGRDDQKDGDERQRQIGLARGMVAFAGSFSNGEAVDSIETEKSRVILHELESGWWIIASIDLTRLPAMTTAAPNTKQADPSTAKPSVEYSSREVSPPFLLLQQLKRAHNIFLLHNGPSLSDLYHRSGREKFCSTLDRFWTRFAQTWDVLLHGSPVVDVYNGVKLAAGGELGIGVGEEEWGSGEREVLEDFARRTEGLVDLVVSRFGEPAQIQQMDPKKAAEKKKTKKESQSAVPEPWMGVGRHPGASDGVVFSGVGNITRASLRDVTQWMEWVYGYGEFAYGVKDNPGSNRRKRRRRHVPGAEDAHKTPAGKSSGMDKGKGKSSDQAQIDPQTTPRPPGIPPPIVSAAERTLYDAPKTLDGQSNSEAEAEHSKSYFGDAETWMKYLTLGIGTSWAHGSQPQGDNDDPDETPKAEHPPMKFLDPAPDVDRVEEMIKLRVQQENAGHFIVGLKGDMSDEDGDDPEDGGDGETVWNSRIVVRTLYVETTKPMQPTTPSANEGGLTDFDRLLNPHKSTKSHPRLRVVVYVHRPFIYVFLFEPQTGSLALSSFYHNLHVYFSPLHKPLSNSTSPARVAARIAAASHPYTTTAPTSGPNTQPIFDLVYDPQTLTVHSSIPNIPEPGAIHIGSIAPASIEAAAMVEAGWYRLEALNVHSAILDTIKNTRSDIREIERTGKTSRGWWIVWMRLSPSSLPPSPSPDAFEQDRELEAEAGPSMLREAFLVRRARDAAPLGSKNGASGGASSGGGGIWRLGMGIGTSEKMGGSAAGWGPKGLAEGIGIDARKYIEGLLSLNR